MRLLRILRSQLLPCECFVGIYETYDGATVEIVEEKGKSCHQPDHQAGRVLPTGPPSREPAARADEDVEARQ
jgi:hypothetical protein